MNFFSRITRAFRSLFADFDSAVADEMARSAHRNSKGTGLRSQDFDLRSGQGFDLRSGVAPQAQQTTLPPAIADFLRKNYRIANPERCTFAEADRVTRLVISGEATGLEGLARFRNLHTVHLDGVKATDLSFPGVDNLRTLTAEACRIVNLSMTANPQLQVVNMKACRGLRSVDLSTCHHLQTVSINSAARQEEGESARMAVLYLPRQSHRSVVDSLSRVVVVEKWER